VSDPVPGWYAELDTIAASDPVLQTLTAVPRKLAVRMECSNEVLSDSVPDAGEVVRNLMLSALAERLDVAFFEGTGANNQPRGLRLTPGIQQVSLGANGGPIQNLDVVADALSLLESANVPPPFVAVMAPRTWGAIRKLKEQSGSNRPLVADPPASDAAPRIFGVPVFTTTSLPINEAQGTSSNASSIYIYSVDPDKGPLLVRRADAEIELDRSRLFDRDASELRGKLRATVVVPQPLSVVRIVGVTP
jgi:HK97 family phage major capsid protein